MGKLERVIVGVTVGERECVGDWDGEESVGDGEGVWEGEDSVVVGEGD